MAARRIVLFEEVTYPFKSTHAMPFLDTAPMIKTLLKHFLAFSILAAIRMTGIAAPHNLIQQETQWRA